MKKLLVLSFVMCSVTYAGFGQQVVLIGLNGDSLRGTLEHVNRTRVKILTEGNEVKKIPFTGFSGMLKWGYYFPVVDGVLARFPVLKNGKAGLTEVVEVPGKSAKDLYQAAVEYVHSNSNEFNRVVGESTVSSTYGLLGVKQQASVNVDAQYKNTEPLKYSDPESGKVIARVVARYEGGGFGCVRLVWFEFDVIMKFKDGRYKYELSNYQYNHYNAVTLLKSPFMAMEDGGNCGSSGSVDDLLKCGNCPNEFDTMFHELLRQSHRVIKAIKEGLENASSEEDDDW